MVHPTLLPPPLVAPGSASCRPVFLPVAGLPILRPFLADRRELVPVGFAHHREPGAKVVLLEEGDPGEVQAQRIFWPFFPAVVAEYGGLARWAVVVTALRDQALAVNSYDHHRTPLLGAVFGEDQRHDLPTKGVQPITCGRLDEEIELLKKRRQDAGFDEAPALASILIGLSAVFLFGASARADSISHIASKSCPVQQPSCLFSMYLVPAKYKAVTLSHIACIITMNFSASYVRRILIQVRSASSSKVVNAYPLVPIANSSDRTSKLIRLYIS